MKRFIYILAFALCNVFAQTVNVGAQNVQQAEYFVDTDPGVGLATPMVAYDGNFNDAFETVLAANAGSWTVGMHVIGVRIKDNANNWGPVFRTAISVQNPYVVPVINVAAAEFFWDTDPGQGNGTAMLAFDGNFNDAMEKVMSATPAPALGMHVLNIRIRDGQNNWGPLFKTIVDVQSIYVMPVVNIAAAECFWDTDPGQGNGTAMLAFDGNFNSAMEAVLATNFGTPALGMHVLNVRVRDAQNHWSPLFRTIVAVQNPYVTPLIRLTNAELFWDTDPGQGNGAPMLAFDGNYNDAYEVAIAAQQAFLLAPGPHVLNVRAQDPAGVWSPLFRTVIYLDSCATTPAVTVTAGGPTTICGGDSILLTATTGYANYYWSRNGIGFGSNSNVQWITTSGNYSCTVLDTSGCPGTSAVITINVQNLNVFVSPPGPLVICAGDSVQLDAGAGYTTYQWSNGSISQTTWVSGTDTVNVVVTSSIGCTDTSSNVIAASVPLPVVPIISQNSDTLFSSSATGNQWYLNGNIIPGATGAYYVANQSGNYTVVVTDVNGCSSSSVPYAYIHMDFGQSVGGTLFTVVYPNPVGDNSILLIHAEGISGTVSVVIMDVTGRIVSVEEAEVINGEAKIAVSHDEYSAGLYVYTVDMQNEARLTGRFTVQ